MTSRERVLASLNHREPDRAALDLSGHRSSGISAIIYPKLRKALGLEPRIPKVYDLIQQLAVVEEDVLDRFGVDTVELGRGFALDDASWEEWTLPDGTDCLVPSWSVPEREGEGWVLRSGSGRVIARMPEGALYFEQCHWPFLDGQEDLSSLEEAFSESMWTAFASPPGPVTDEELVAGARRLRETTDRAIIGLFGGNLLECADFLYRIDHALMMIAGEPDRLDRFLDALMEMHMANLEKYLSLVGPYIDVILFGDDLGMQTGPQMSPAMYREHFKPRHQQLWNAAKQQADVKVMLHCCGGVRELMSDLIEAGLDAINPVQITCRGMEAEGLKRDFGEKLTFWGGGCDTREVLPKGTPQQVADHVREQVSVLSPGGGFVFQQVHNILSDVPPENVIAMLDAVRD